MQIERRMVHDIVDLVAESDIARVYAILNAFVSFDGDELLTDEQKKNMQEGFEQIERGEYITAEEYMKKRGLKL